MLMAWQDDEMMIESMDTETDNYKTYSKRYKVYHRAIGIDSEIQIYIY